MKPRLGVWANSAALSEVCSVTVWFGLTVSNMPLLSDGVNALNFAVPVVSVGPSPNACTQYVNLGFAADKHGEPEAQNWLIRAGSTSVVLFIGASARNRIVPRPVRRSNTADASCPFTLPAVSDPKSAPTTT